MRSGPFQPEATRRDRAATPAVADRDTRRGIVVAPHGLILDLDGTLVDSYRAIADSLNHARTRYDLEPLSVDTVRQAVGHGLEQLIHRWVGPDRIEAGVGLFRERYAEVFDALTEPLPGVDSALRTLAAAGYGLALASNKPARFSGAILRQFGWDPLFRCVEGPDTVGTTKPDPAMLQTCLETLGSSANQTLYVGDMPLDAVSGRRAGLDVVLVCGGSATRTDLLAAGLPVLSGFAALPAFLNDRGWPA